MKRPQVQILSPRLVFTQARGSHRFGGNLSCWKYNSQCVCSPVSQQQQGIWAFRIGPPLRQPLSAGDEHRATRSLAQDGDDGSVWAAVRSSWAVLPS